MKQVFLNSKVIFGVYLALGVISAIQLYLVPPHVMVNMPPIIQGDMLYQADILQQFLGKTFTDYNNFRIFKTSFGHLLHGSNLYGIFPDEHWDFYKYSPTFAFVMGLFYYIPDAPGLIIWNVANATALYWAIIHLPININKRQLILWAIAIELLTSLQNAQSNGLMAAFMVGGYLFMNKGDHARAALFIVASAFIKVYGIVALLLFLFYPNKWKAALWTAIWTCVFAIVPLVLVPVPKLMWQYGNWLHLLQADKATSVGLSVSGVAETLFHLHIQSIVTLTGVVLLLSQLVRWKLFRYQPYQLSILASILIWVVVFNHKAESPTFIIAATGALLWYFNGNERTSLHSIMLWSVLIFTCLSATDLFPPIVKKEFLVPYRIKAIPCILVWLVIWYETIFMKAPRHLAD